MKYTDPNDVRSPKDAVSDVEVLYNEEDDVSLARVTWHDKPVLAIRWNISFREWDDPEKIAETKTCVGMPVSRGLPTWFILPEDLFDATSDLYKAIENVVNERKDLK